MTTKRVPVVANRFRVLSCSRCGKSVTVRASEDPAEGHGWPKHRCGQEVQAFDSQVETNNNPDR